MKIVREHYLRDDIKCGSPPCLICYPEIEEISMDMTEPEAKIEPTKLSNLISINFSGQQRQHYLVPDTNVVLHQVELSLY